MTTVVVVSLAVTGCTKSDADPVAPEAQAEVEQTQSVTTPPPLLEDQNTPFPQGIGPNMDMSVARTVEICGPVRGPAGRFIRVIEYNREGIELNYRNTDRPCTIEP